MEVSMNSFHKVLIFTVALIVCVVTISVSIVSTIKSIRQLRDETNRICLEQKTNKKTKAVKKDISTVVDDYLTVAERGGIKISKIMIKDNTNAEMDFMFSSYNVKNYFMNILNMENFKINSLSLNSRDGEIKGKISVSVMNAKRDGRAFENAKFDHLYLLFDGNKSRNKVLTKKSYPEKKEMFTHSLPVAECDAVLIGEIGDDEHKSFYLKVSGKDEIVSVVGRLTMENGRRYIIPADGNSGMSKIHLMEPV